MLGRARQIKVTKENTIIVDGMGDQQAIKDRVSQIRAQIGVTSSEYDKEKLQERLGRRRGRHQGRCRYRDRDEGEEAAHRGCSERHQGRR